MAPRTPHLNFNLHFLRRRITHTANCNGNGSLNLPLRSTFPSSLRRMMSTGTDLPPAPPLLQKLRSDLKDAMRTKNTSKLDALRNLLSSINSANKPPHGPLLHDTQILSLINKQLSTSHASIADFKTAGREDLVEREQKQVEVLSGYADSVEMVREEEVQAIVEEAVGKVRKDVGEGGKVQMGNVMREVSRVLDETGKAWNKAEVAALVKRVVG